MNNSSGELAEEICALANKSGGIIIIGVIDSSDVKDKNWITQLNGFEVVDEVEIKARITGKLSRGIDLEVFNYEFEKNNYIVINISQSKNNMISTSKGKYYIRDGRSSRPLLPEEVQKKIKEAHFYDWSWEILDVSLKSVIDHVAAEQAYSDYLKRKEQHKKTFSINNFYEAVGITRNGLLTKGGLLFLGTPEAIDEHLGLYEYRECKIFCVNVLRMI